MTKYIVLVALILGLPFGAFSQENSEQEELRMPASGSLASTRTGTGSEAVEGPWAPEGSDLIDDVSPVSGSISRISPQFWRVRLFNNSEDRYDVSLELQQLSAGGQVLRRDSFSYNLRAGESVERDVRAHINSTQSDLRLRNWRKQSRPTAASDNENLILEE